jgi:hypothetical protein
LTADNRNSFTHIHDFVFLLFLCFLAAAIVGQVLNAGVLKALGVNGTYYGTRLGKNVPWVSGFPFNVVSRTYCFLTPFRVCC